MAETGKVTARLNGRFPQGARVELVERVGDWYAPGSPVVASKPVGPDGVEFTGVKPGRYWIVAEVNGVERSIAVTAKTSDGSAPRATTRTLTKAQQQQLRAPAGSNAQVITGARSTADLKLPRKLGRVEQAAIVNTAIPKAHVPNDRDEREDHPAPALKQAEARDVPQRSATPVGQATPRDVKGEEPQPKPSQADVDELTPQRSATGLGEATPKQPDEEVPHQRQEDAPKGLEQRSATGTGETTPVPQGKATAAQAAEDSPQAAAAGGVVEGVRQGRKAPRARRDTQAKRAQVSRAEAKEAVGEDLPSPDVPPASREAKEK